MLEKNFNTGEREELQQGRDNFKNRVTIVFRKLEIKKGVRQFCNLYFGLPACQAIGQEAHFVQMLNCHGPAYRAGRLKPLVYAHIFQITFIEFGINTRLAVEIQEP